MTIKAMSLPPVDLSRAAVAARVSKGLHVIRIHAMTADRAQLQQAVLELHHLAQRLLTAELGDEREAA